MMSMKNVLKIISLFRVILLYKKYVCIFENNNLYKKERVHKLLYKYIQDIIIDIRSDRNMF